MLFCNGTATTELYALSLHDALPICPLVQPGALALVAHEGHGVPARRADPPDGDADDRTGPGEHRKSTRLNSSHANISYAAFCLTKKVQPHAGRDDAAHHPPHTGRPH